MTTLLFAAGLLLLIAGADQLVRGASRLALSAGISPLVVGLTVVAFGTSAPELAVSAGAVLNGNSDLAVGNVVGSNIFNILLILGGSALVAPLIINAQLIRQEVPLMIGASLLLALLGLDDRLLWTDGAMLLALLIGYTTFVVIQSRRQTRQTHAEFATHFEAPRPSPASVIKPLLQILAGLGGLVLGADWLVDASVDFAKSMGVSDLVIGLTIVAAGTSMPELATSIVAAFKGERDIAIGNVIGSNIFNILGCLGVAGLLSGNAGLGIAPSVQRFDLWVMLAVAFVCLPIFFRGSEISRWTGGMLVALYVAYALYVVLAASDHDALPWYSGVMLLFVLPLVAITMIAIVWRRVRPGPQHSSGSDAGR